MKRYGVPASICALMLLLALVMAVFSLPLRSTPVALAEGVTPSGVVTELSIDDGSSLCVAGQGVGNKGKPGFGWVNKLTPTTYPATLRAITIAFNRQITGAGTDDLYRIVAYRDPESDGPSPDQQPDVSFIARAHGTEVFTTFTLLTPLKIESGSFVVGAIDVLGVADLPAFFDIPGKSDPPGSDSFITLTQGTVWTPLSETFAGDDPDSCQAPGSWIIRATVETDPVDSVGEQAVIKDPLAKEPWAAAVTSFLVTQGSGAGARTDVIVTNYVSDNLTIINTADNTFENIPVGDGPGNTPDGPFGVVSNKNGDKVYVTLFGSNTIPSKEFPIDFSTVEPGRVLVLFRDPDGGFRRTVLSFVGEGPGFPALSLDDKKLYVPCGGADTVDVIDTLTNVRTNSIAVGPNPTSCTLSIDGSKLYVTNFGDGTVSVISTKTEQKIKEIPAPEVALPNVEAPPLGANPWQGAVSGSNGNLYVTYWGTTGDQNPNGAIVEIDTCTDEVKRVIVESAATGTPAGSPGATGIPAPAMPLTRDSETGATLEAGGGGGGPFGIVNCRTDSFDLNPNLFFTNDGLGLIGLIDSRTDQAITALSAEVSMCAKPRALACISSGGGGLLYVPCGQPENSVLVVRVPDISPFVKVPGHPTIESVKVNSNKLKIKGSNFVNKAKVELFVPGSNTCLTFSKAAKIKNGGTIIIQKGSLSDGRSVRAALGNVSTLILRVTNPNGETQIFIQSL